MSWSWWPENSNGEEHEGWIQPLFFDGEEGTGTSNAHGIVFDCYTPSERVRPYSEVSNLRMVCSCGWHGGLVAVADLSDDDLDPRWMEPTETGEEHFLRQWHAHLAPLRTLDDLAALTDQALEIASKIETQVEAARETGASWLDIGRALGMTKQGAQQRYGK